jgi:drug/metabolite transporter (DMT)-like permease
MKRESLNADILLLLSAAIWGFAFVAQRAGMEHLGPFIFNGVRFALGGAVLLPFIFWRSAVSGQRPAVSGERTSLLRDGIIAGAVLFGGATLQQWGIVSTSAGKAGFITGLYVILVPILGLFIGQRTGRNTWLGALMAMVGLYLLSVRGGFRMSMGDLLVLGGAVFWAFHVQIIGRFVLRQDPLALASTQFFTVSALSMIGALFFEDWNTQALLSATGPILYAGLASTGIAYTLQVVAQRRAHPSHAAILLSLEAVFAVLGGWLLLSESLGPRELTGCVIMLAGMLFSQLGGRRR